MTDRQKISKLAGLIRLAGSMWLGLAAAADITIYLAAASIAPKPLSQLLRTDPAKVFSHPLLWCLAGLLCVNLLIATFTRIPRTLKSLGAWASHLGFILLLCGAAWQSFAGILGEAVSFRTEAGFSDVDQASITGTYAVIIIDAATGREYQTPINIPSQAGPVALDVAIDAPDGVSLRAVLFGPNGVPESPDPGPALLVNIAAEGLQFVQPLSFQPFTRADTFHRLALPSGREFYLAFTRQVIPLGATIRIVSIDYETYPASLVPKDFRCDFQITQPDKTGQVGQIRSETLSLNKPVRAGDYLISQGSWLPDPAAPQQLVFLVSKRSGIWAIWAGAGLIIAGMGFSFYVKPIIAGSKERCG